MDFFETVKKRKSVRKFLSKKVSSCDIQKVLEVVNLAPSAGNLQAYKVFIIKDLEKRKKIAFACSNQVFIAEAPMVLVFCANPKESESRYGERGRKLYCLQDATIACSYAQLAATSLGLASCWVGAFSERVIQKILGANLLPVAVLPLGYQAENPMRPRRKSLKELSKIVK